MPEQNLVPLLNSVKSFKVQNTIEKSPFALSAYVTGTGRRLLRRVPEYPRFVGLDAVTKQTTGLVRCVDREGLTMTSWGGSYRVAYLLLPLQHVRNGVVPWKLHVAVEHDALTQYGGDVHRILEAIHCGKRNTIQLLYINLADGSNVTAGI